MMTGKSENPAPIFQWLPEYAVGVEEIDREHQRLFALAETMHQAMLAGKGKKFLKSQVAGLIDFAKRHFSHEERLMKVKGYPERREHRLRHDEIRARLRVLHDRWESGETTLTIEAMLLFMECLREQVTGIDLRLAGYLKATGAGAEVVGGAMRPGRPGRPARPAQ